MKTATLRSETDSMGTVELPADALYGPQTQRAITNFTIATEPLPWEFIVAVILIKQAAATANVELQLLDAVRGQAIIDSCALLQNGEFCDQFPVSIFQTGSGPAPI